MPLDLTWPWLTLLGLGIFHGLNPGMGWLFAVALGLQERRRSAVWGALLPLALGHALAVGIAVLAMLLVGHLVSIDALKWGVAIILFGFGVFRLVSHRHPRFGGMRVGGRDLTVWSFLMATAHGAGLMVLPFIFGTGAVGPAEGAHAGHAMPAAAHHAAVPTHEVGMEAAGGHATHAAHLLADLPAEPIVGILATLVHTLGYLLVMGLLAVVVYEKVGLRLLRTHWLNLDTLWAVALILTAVLTLLL